MKVTTRSIVRGAVIAGVYAGVCLLLAPLSYGVLQVRVSEALTLLPVLWPEAVPGLVLGALIANLAGPFGLGLVDVVFGTAATAIAAVLTYRYRRSRSAYLFPVIVNGLIVGGYLPLVTGMERHWWTFPAAMLSVAAGEAVAVFALGVPLLHAIQRIGLED